MRSFLKNILLLSILCSSFSAIAQSNDGYTMVNGVEYKITKHGTGKKVQMGDVLTVDLLAKVGDEVLADTKKNGKPTEMRVESDIKPGDLKGVLPFLSQGDDVAVRISCDTLIIHAPQTSQQLPPWLKNGNSIVVNLSILSVETMDEYKKGMEAKQATMMKEMEESAKKQLPIDDKILQDYFAKNKIKAKKTASGLYYTIKKEGTGAKAKAGQKVSMYYIGKTTEGKQFDANVDANFHLLSGREIFTFPLGEGQVIKGWDEGVQLLNKGCKATLYLPSPLAYGTQSPSPEIPANSILIFDVEVVSIN